MTGLTTSQAEKRRGFIGGTDAPRILGISPFGGPLQVYEDKMGLSERPHPGPGAHWGRRLEAVVADEYAEQRQVKLRRLVKPVIHPEFDFIGGYIDRRIVGQPALLEVKTGTAFGASEHWGEPGTDEVPDDYYAQVQHYLMVTGLSWADLAVLLGGQDFRVYHIERAEDFIVALLEAEVAFWRQHIETATPPPVDGTEASRDYLRRRYPEDVGTIRAATPEEEAMIQGLVTARAVRKAADESVLLAENTIKDAIGLDAGLTGVPGTVTWKAQTSKHINWKGVAHEWKNLMAPYIPSEDWEEVTINGAAAVTTFTEERKTRVLRVKGEPEE